MKTAAATGVLALQEHGLKEIPEGLFSLVKLRVRSEEKGAVCVAPCWLLDKREQLKLMIGIGSLLG